LGAGQERMQPLESHGPRRVKAVEHALDILDCMARAGRPIGVSDIASRVGLSKATVHHLLATLESRRFVMQDPQSTLYRLSWALYELGSSVVRDVELTRVARPYLDRLASETGESVLLGILDSDAVLYLDRGEPQGGLRMVANAGRRGSLHATASGKVLLAFCDRVILERVLERPLKQMTRTTVIEPTTLRRQLGQVRSRGYATCWQEREAGLCSVAVPLKDYTGSVVGSLALAGPASRLTPRTLKSHLSPLRQAAYEIELRIGGARAPAEP
jgi:DNA-binding IclR family transcriptional regulator